MRVNALVRVAVERWTQVTPKSEEVKILPPDTTAVWYWPVEDNDTDIQFLVAPVVRSVHVTPKSVDVNMEPALETAAL
jgi:hypothetical protein